MTIARRHTRPLGLAVCILSGVLFGCSARDVAAPDSLGSPSVAPATQKSTLDDPSCQEGDWLTVESTYPGGAHLSMDPPPIFGTAYFWNGLSPFHAGDTVTRSGNRWIISTTSSGNFNFKVTEVTSPPQCPNCPCANVDFYIPAR